MREKISVLAHGIADAVFFDPFSPKKQPELWSVDLFQKIFQIMASGARLTTYSCARQARENLQAAGFRTEDGPVVGRVSPGTIATKP